MDKVRKAGADELALEERWFPIQVKQKDKAGRPDMDAFETAMRRVIVPLTVREILDEQIAHKLA